MKKCPVCSNEVSDDAKFCDRCGTKLVKTVVCPTCGKETIGGFAFCQNCGSPLDVSTEKPQPQSAPQNAPQNAPQAAPQQYAPQSVPQGFAPRTGDQKKRVPKLGIILGAVGAGLAVIVIVIIALFASGVFGKKSGQNFALYVKDREIFFSEQPVAGHAALCLRLVGDKRKYRLERILYRSVYKTEQRRIDDLLSG